MIAKKKSTGDSGFKGQVNDSPKRLKFGKSLERPPSHPTNMVGGRNPSENLHIK